MEIGNMLFGHSRGTYELPSRDLVNSNEWIELLDKTGSDEYGYSDINANERGGFENEIFAIRPYWWEDENDVEINAPNFLYKPTGFEIRWYKYPFRDSYMSEEFSQKQLLEIFQKCIDSID